MSIDVYIMKINYEEYRTSIQIYKKTAMRLKAIARSENETYDMIIKRLLRGRQATQKGYIHLLKPDHPNSNLNGYIFEHRFLMSKHLDRPLIAEECVHHKDGNPKNNILSNLELMTHQEHRELHDNLGVYNKN